MLKIKFNFIKFLFTKYFLFHFGLLIIVSLILVVIVGYSLKYYTSHGEEISTPKFVDLTLDEANILADENNLIIVVIDSVYNEKQEKGLILKQIPTTGFKIKEKRKIFITINSFSTPTLKMPNLIDKTFKEAKIILKSYGLKVGRLYYIPDIAKDRVLNQKNRGEKIPAGTQIEKGTRIDLVLGDGLNEDKSEIPMIISFKLNEAKQVLKESLLNIGTVKYDGSVISKSDTINAFIYKQFPEPREKADKGTYIDVWMTLDYHKIPK